MAKNKITAEPALSQVTDASAQTQTLFLFYFIKLATAAFSNCCNRDMHFPTVKQQNKHLACCLSEPFEDSEHKGRGHVETPSKEWHLQEECGTCVITLSWCMLNKH